MARIVGVDSKAILPLEWFGNPYDIPGVCHPRDYTLDEAYVRFERQLLAEKGPALREAIFAKFDEPKSEIMIEHVDANLKVCCMRA